LVWGSGIRFAQPPLEGSLQLAQSHLDVAAEDLSQLRGAFGFRPFRQYRFDLPRRRVVEDPGLVAGACQGIEGEVGCEVDEGARDGGDRDAAMGRSLDASHAVGGHAVHAPLRGRRHFRRGRGSLEKAPDVRGRSAAQHRTVAAGPHGGEEGGLHAPRAVPDAVHPRMLPQQRAGPQSLSDLRERDSCAEQLRASDHTMRPRRQMSENCLYCGRLVSHCDT
jgi:hypothetical protein